MTKCCSEKHHLLFRLIFIRKSQKEHITDQEGLSSKNLDQTCRCDFQSRSTSDTHKFSNMLLIIPNINISHIVTLYCGSVKYDLYSALNMILINHCYPIPCLNDLETTGTMKITQV